MLAFSHISAAYKAGVFDIVPVDDEKGFRQAGALPDAMYLLGRAMGSLIQDLESAFARYSQEELMQIEPDYLRIKGIVDKRIERVEAEREKAMCRNLIENYIPGSALLCGIDHLKPLEELLSNRFDLKVYKTGEKLFASLSQGFQ